MVAVHTTGHMNNKFMYQPNEVSILMTIGRVQVLYTILTTTNYTSYNKLSLCVIFTYDYTTPKPHFSTRVSIACQLHEHANKLSQK